MAAIKQFKVVSTLPPTLEANAIYYVLKNIPGFGDHIEVVVTDASAVAKMIGADLVNYLVAQAFAGFNTLKHVATIAARNSDAAGVAHNTVYLVTDATGDGTVASGAATYFYDKLADTFTKLAEYESMDVVVAWSSISGKPSSTPLAIDTAVGQSHGHSNMAVLNKIAEASGAPTYNGADWPIPWGSTGW